MSDSIDASLTRGEDRPGRGESMWRLPARPFDVELWIADLGTMPSPSAVAGLSSAELARASRFVFDRDRQRYLSSHCALAQLLSTRVALPPGPIEWEFGEQDKPRLSKARDCAFNLSHCDDLALIGISAVTSADCEIGVDIEHLHEVRDASELAALNFTEREQGQLRRCAPEHRSLTFLRGWTRKEACLKAIGSGLSIAPATFECGLDKHAGSTEIGGIAVEYMSLDVDHEHVAAVAVTRPVHVRSLGNPN